MLRFGPFLLDASDARLLRDDQPIDLPPKAFAVLNHLASQPGRLVTKDELLDAVWKHRFVSESVLKTAINTIRDALGDDARASRYVETVPRRGYRFIAPMPDTSALVVSRTQPGVRAGHEDWIVRSAALGQMDKALTAVAAGKTRVLLVGGEAGIGKSTLIERFARAVRAAGSAAIGMGQCVEHHGSVEPYLPVLDALNALSKGPAGSALLALLRQAAPTWLVQLPWHLTVEDRRQLQREVIGATQDRMLREFGEIMDRFTEARGLLLVLEDLHWSDPATVQLLGYLARRQGRARLLLVGSYRPADVIVSDHPLKAMRQELRLRDLCDEIDLEAFSESEVERYLAHRRDGSPRPAPAEVFVRMLHDHTGGVPLFVEAVVEELEQRGVLAERLVSGASPQETHGGGQSPLPVPRNLFAVLEQQKSRLPESAQRWLEAASAAGVEFAHLTLADALGADADAMQATFDELVRHQSWLRDAGAVALPDGRISVRYAFRHAVYRQALYDLTHAATRIRLHRAIAQALTSAHSGDLEGVAAELAMHHERAQDPVRALCFLALGARVAMRRFAAREALATTSKARQMLEQIADCADLAETELQLCAIEGAALMQVEGVTSARARAAFDRAQILIDEAPGSAARVPALQGIWWLALARGEVNNALKMASRITKLAQHRNDPLLRFAAHAALGVSLVHAGDAPRANDHLTQALDDLRSLEAVLPTDMFSNDPEVQLGVYHALALWSLGRPSQAAAQADHALLVARRIGHPMSQLLALHINAMLHLSSEAFEPALVLCDEALALAGKHRLTRGVGAHTWTRGRALAALGDVQGGLDQMVQGKAVLTAAGLQYGLTWWHHAYGDVCLQAGRNDEAAAAIDAGLALAAGTGEAAMVADLHRLAARVAINRERCDLAIAILHEALAVAQRQGAFSQELAIVTELGQFAEIDRAERNRWLSARLARWQDPIGPPFVVRARAVLASLA